MTASTVTRRAPRARVADASFRLRATRAAPPGPAAQDASRRATYGAALAQFEQLLAAAATATAITRPLHLSSALDQAARAIVAVRGGSPWFVGGTGLSCSAVEGDLADMRVAVTGDAFAALAEATQSPVFTQPVTLGALWASLPEVAELLPCGDWPLPLRLVPSPPRLDRATWPWVEALLVGFDGAAEALPDHLAAYFPAAAGAALLRLDGRPVQHETPFGLGTFVLWPSDDRSPAGHIATLTRLADDGLGFDPRWLRPSVGGVLLTPLQAWWALLFGLSTLASRDPARWAGTVDLDRSPTAAALASLLDIALTRIPELVLEGLESEGQ